jgi:nitronate monooxygenase
MSRLTNRLTDSLQISYPILSAPMAFAGGGALAAAVTRSGGLGLIGGGYGDRAWLDDQFKETDGQRVGVGFITWSLKESPSLLTTVLAYRPAAVMLSFGDPRPFADEIRNSGTKIICQCQNRNHVWDAIDVGADIIVAQGAEAGGHGATRGTLTFVPEAADLLAANAPDTALLAAGGIADGRGLAAAIMLGADGVLIGTRFWASKEALVSQGHHAAIVESSGDDTIRTTTPDIARQIKWPPGFTARIRRNAFTERWHGREDELEANISVEGPAYRRAFSDGDPDDTGVWFGEAAGVIHEIEAAEKIVKRILDEASILLGGTHSNFGGT